MKQTSESVASKAGRILANIGTVSIRRPNNMSWGEWEQFLDDVKSVAASALAQKEPEAAVRDERKAFEAWAKGEWANGQSIPHNAWLGWQAAKASTVPSQIHGCEEAPAVGDGEMPPIPLIIGNKRYYLQRLLKQIEEHGDIVKPDAALPRVKKAAIEQALAAIQKGTTNG